MAPVMVYLRWYWPHSAVQLVLPPPPDVLVPVPVPVPVEVDVDVRDTKVVCPCVTTTLSFTTVWALLQVIISL